MDKEELQAELDILFKPQPDKDGFFPPEYPPERITKFHKLDIPYMDRLDYEGSTIHPYTRICKPDEHRLISLSRDHDVSQRLFVSAIQLFGDSIIAYHDKKERKGSVDFNLESGTINDDRSISFLSHYSVTRVLSKLLKGSASVPLKTPQQYVQSRQAYSYESCKSDFSIIQTGNLKNVGNFTGIFATSIPSRYPDGINLRRFEVICQEVFRNCSRAMHNNVLLPDHIRNLKNISAAIVCWKMSSQGGRAPGKVQNMLNKWTNNTASQLIGAYHNRQVQQFRIGGVRIPTATAFMRFLFPNDFGIMDSRVVGKYTQPKNITSLSVRNDGYINDTAKNIASYDREYVPFLRREAKWLNDQNVTFEDVDALGEVFRSSFRACDIEMALF